MALTPEMVAAVSRVLATHAGLELPAWVVEARAAARIAKLGVAAEGYATLIDSVRGAGELEELIETVRVGESRLFRHRQQIAAITDVVVPALRASRKRSIKVWSAGCAAGEEPYTLAAVLGRALPGVQITIIATDVSADAIEAAERGCYPASAVADIPDDWRDAFLDDGPNVRVAPEIAALVRFERANLAAQLDPSPIRNCDLVWCRNVLIYFTPAARKVAVDRLISALVPGGFLFAGYSESLRDIAGIEPMRAGDAVYYVRRDAEARAVLKTPAAGMPRLNLDKTPPPVLARLEPKRDPTETFVLLGQPTAREITGELMRRLGQAGLERLVVDLDSAEMLDDELAPVLRRARSAARAAHVELEIRATRTGSKRWLSRLDLDEEDAP